MNKEAGVLIVGGGLAGLISAISAARKLKKEKILLITSGDFKTTNSFLSPWNIRIKEKDFEEKIIKAGHNLNDKTLVKTLVREIPNRFNELVRYGINFRKTSLGYAPIGTKFPAEKAIEILVKKALDEGVIIKENTKLLDLITKNEKNKKKVIAAILKEKDDIKILNVKSVVLASGGIGGLYEKTTNTISADGSVVGAALKVGIKLVNPEFIMFHLFLITDKRVPNVLLSGEILSHLRFVDEKNQEFFSENNKEALKKNDFHHIFPSLVEEIWNNSKKSRLFMDFSNFEEKEFERLKKENEFGWILNYIKRDWKVEFSAAEHYWIGGIANKMTKTDVENIFVAGEIAGGLHGANRVGGNAIPECLVFGKIAGEKAADYAKNSKFEFIKKEINLEDYKKGDKDLKKIRENMWKFCGPERNKNGLIKLIDFLDNEYKNASIEKKNCIIAAKAIALSSLKRKCNIGVFKRTDINKTCKKPKSSYISFDDLNF